MGKDEESEDLRERISKLSDEELLNMVEVEPAEYRKEALDYAKSELMARRIQFQEPLETSAEEADSTTDEPQVMRKLTNCKGVPQAGMLKGLLTAEGITCEIRGEYLSIGAGEIPFSECYPELWVLNDDLERAKEILDGWDNKEVDQPASWTCHKCGEENEGQFSSCWRCGSVAT